MTRLEAVRALCDIGGAAAAAALRKAVDDPALPVRRAAVQALRELAPAGAVGSLVERLKDQPFTLLGINSDSSRSALKKTMEDEKITWPNIYDGPKGEGKIACQWNVYGWPTIYILDHEGIIRHKDLRDDDMEKAVNELLKKM